MIGSAVVALGLVGLYVSLYLSYKEATGTDLGACPLTEDECTAVTKSKYSKFLGIPLAYYGVLYYSMILLMGTLCITRGKKLIIELTAYLTVIGFIDSIIFVYIQGYLIEAWCFYCLISAVTSTLLFFVMLPTLIDKIVKK